MKYETSEETISFELYFRPVYWDLPPKVKIFVDDVCHIAEDVTDINNYFKFQHTLEFNKKHRLQIYRYNKLDTQCVVSEDGTLKDQLLIIDKIKIDGINIRNIIDYCSYNEPEYPEPWATQERQCGVVLEQRVIAETVFGHNGLWTLEFTSPFYMFLSSWMYGDL